MSRARCTMPPARSAARAVPSVESESTTMISSTSGVSTSRAWRRAPTTRPTVRSSFRAGITTLIRVPAARLAASSRSGGQSRQCVVRRCSHVLAWSCIPGTVPGTLPGGTTGMLPGGDQQAARARRAWRPAAAPARYSPAVALGNRVRG